MLLSATTDYVICGFVLHGGEHFQAILTFFVVFHYDNRLRCVQWVKYDFWQAFEEIRISVQKKCSDE